MYTEYALPTYNKTEYTLPFQIIKEDLVRKCGTKAKRKASREISKCVSDTKGIR